MSNKLAKDDTLQSLVTANQAISTGLGALAKDASIQQLIAAVQGLSIGSSGSGSSSGSGTGVNIDLSKLETTDKSSLVSAINEIVRENATQNANIQAIQILLGQTHIDIPMDNLESLEYMVNLLQHNYHYTITTSLSNDLSGLASQNLGSSLTQLQIQAIANGTFHASEISAYDNNGNAIEENTVDIYAGDFFEKEVTYWDPYSKKEVTKTIQMVVGHCDYRDDLPHHLVVYPYQSLFKAQMNSTATIAGMYPGSDMYNNYLTAALEVFKEFFGESHIMVHSELFPNSVDESYYINGALVCEGRKVDLMNVPMVYGEYTHANTTKARPTNGENKTIHPYLYTFNTEPLAIFKQAKGYRGALAINITSANEQYWLRDTAGSRGFACISATNGSEGTIDANGTAEVVPYAYIY